MPKNGPLQGPQVSRSKQNNIVYVIKCQEDCCLSCIRETKQPLAKHTEDLLPWGRTLQSIEPAGQWPIFQL